MDFWSFRFLCSNHGDAVWPIGRSGLDYLRSFSCLSSSVLRNNYLRSGFDIIGAVPVAYYGLGRDVWASLGVIVRRVACGAWYSRGGFLLPFEHLLMGIWRMITFLAKSSSGLLFLH